MKFFLLLSALVLSLSFAPKERLYQVTTSHPHELHKLAPHIETVSQNGRLWIVRLRDNAPMTVHNYLRPTNGTEKSYFPSLEKSTFEASDDVLKYTTQVSSDFIRADVEFLSSYESRAAGSTGNQDAVTKLEGRLTSLGYAVKRICYIASACSLIADKTVPGTQVILVEGHIDSVGKKFAGADDNGSGTAVIMEMARILRNYPAKKTIRFFITNGEEGGLRGATHYVNQLTSENRLKEFDLVINMDMVGYNSNGIVELETNPEWETLANWFAELAHKYTTLKSKITLNAWGSDHVPFLNKKIPSLLTIEDWSTKTPCYHQACDKPDTLNYDYAAEIAKLNIAAVISKQ